MSYYSGGGLRSVHEENTLSKTNIMSYRKKLTADSAKLVFIMVGLPGRGKSYISRKLCQFLCWKGYHCMIFNVGMYRRSTSLGKEGRADFFDTSNVEATAAREQAAMDALADLFLYLEGGGDMAIFDATNSTRQRRVNLRRIIREHNPQIGIVHIESICTDKEILKVNMLSKISDSPDFIGMSEEDALKDLQARIDKYERNYESLDCTDESYIQLFDLSSKVSAHHVYGRITKSLLAYLMSIHVGGRPIYLTRAACRDDSSDAPLSKEGLEFAEKLKLWVENTFGTRENPYKDTVVRHHDGRVLDSPLTVKIMTSTLSWAVQTSSFLDAPAEEYGVLNPLDKGSYRGFSLNQIKSKNEEFFDRWERNSFSVRFPGGESYSDLVNRLEPTLIEIEQQMCPVLVIGHRSVLQVLYCYLSGIDIREVASVSIPHKVVIEFKPSKGGIFLETRHYLDGSDRSEVAIESPSMGRPHIDSLES